MTWVAFGSVARFCEQWWKGVKVNRGETVISVKSLCKLCNLSNTTVIKVLKGLEKSGEIERTHMYHTNSKIKILNYIDYQAPSKVKMKSFSNKSLTSSHKQDIYSNIYTDVDDNIYIIEPEKILKKMLDSGAVVEQFCMKEHITVEQFKQLGEEVINEWKLTGKERARSTPARKRRVSTCSITSGLKLVSASWRATTWMLACARWWMPASAWWMPATQ